MINYLQRQKVLQFITIILFLLPILSLVLNAISWLKYGIDVPLEDDWGDYVNGNLNSFKLDYLISSANDTMSPLYRIFNALAYLYLDANSVAYQLISMLAVLGSLLFLQWKLLSLVLPNKLIIASIFSLSLLILQPDSYWGGTNGAYIQAVPLIFNLAIIYIAIRQPWRSSINHSILLFLGFMSGFSYISGAFSTLALSLLFILISPFMIKANRKAMLHAGLIILIPALITVLAQLWILMIVQKGVHTGTPFSLPVEKYFWLYILGKIARSLMLSPEHYYLTFIFAVTASLLSIIAVYWSLGFIIRSSKNAELEKTGVIYISIFTIIAIYLVLVAAGRVNLYPAGMVKTNKDMFFYGFPRFHYFWVTFLWPWVITVFFCKVNETGNANEKITPFLIANAIGVFLMIYAGTLSHPQYYLTNSEGRARGLKCLIEHKSLKKGIMCPDLYFIDIKPAVINAVILNAAFTRTIPFHLSTIPLERALPAPLFQLTPDAFSAITMYGAKRLDSDDNAYKFKATNNDPQLIINIDDINQTKKCRILEVGASIKSPQASIVQLFYLKAGQSQFSELSSSSIEVKGSNQFETIYFTLTNQQGFGNSIRLDPTNKKQAFELKNIVVRCRLNDKQFSYN